jgi:hypothetical protein
MKTKYLLLIGFTGLALFFLGKKFLFGEGKPGTKLIQKLKSKGNATVKTKVPEPPSHFFKIDTTGDLDKDIQTFVKAKEGGLSNDPNDTPPADDPAPGTNGYHTNIGITWSTYKEYCKRVNKATDVQEWLAMKPALWGDVFMRMFAGKYQKATGSKLINYQLGLWAWGSPASAQSILKRLGGIEKVAEMVKNEGAAETFAKLVMERDSYYHRLVEKKPEKGKYLKGWKNANFSFYKNFQQYA